MEGILKEIAERRSVRGYAETAVPAAVLERIAEAGRLAPTSRNSHNLKVVMVTDKAAIRALQAACKGQPTVGAAAAVAVVCGTATEQILSCGQAAHTVNGSICGTFLMLQAQHEGLGTCWIAGYDEAQLAAVIGLPADWRPILALTLGYPDYQPHPRDLPALDTFVSYNKF